MAAAAAKEAAKATAKAKLEGVSGLRLKLIRAILQTADGPTEISCCKPLPRTPCFRAAIQLDNGPRETILAWVPIYSSAREHNDSASKKFKEES